MKVCGKCKVEKSVSCFSKDKNRADGLTPRCKDCCRAYRESRKEERRLYRESHKEEKRENDQARKYRDKILVNEKVCTVCKELKSAEFFSKHAISADGLSYRCRDCVKAHQGKPEFKSRNNERRRLRRQTDPVYKLIGNMRRLVYRCIAGIGKNLPTFEYIGMTPDELKIHLESLFLPGMTWENREEWHIDHVRPLSSFPFYEHEPGSPGMEALIHEASHYSNLQPLWAVDNLRKGSTWESHLV